MSFIVLWILTTFPIFHKMDDISAQQSKGSETVALSDDDLTTVWKEYHSISSMADMIGQ